MHVLIEFGGRILETMFGVGIVVSSVAMVLGLIDDIGTFIKY